jgi:hypothetical protein
VAIEDGVNSALGGHSDITREATDEQLADFASTPVRLVALGADDQRLDLRRQLIGVADRPAGAIGECGGTLLAIAGEHLVTILREMPNSRQTSVMLSPSRSRATKRRRSSITEHAFHGIHTPRLTEQAESVTHVSGTMCHLCLGLFRIS